MTKYVGAKQRSERTQLQRAVLGMLATGMVAWPSFSPVYASDYTRLDGGTNVTNGNVTDIYVGKVSGNNGVNVFQKFTVDAGDIANMRFNQKDQNVHVNNLLNMVQERINVSGTVNALRNGKIGGNLYFISPNGMVVNSGGAINTGSLTVMTPTMDFFNYIRKEMKEVDKEGGGTEQKEVDVTYNIFTNEFKWKKNATETSTGTLTEETAAWLAKSGTETDAKTFGELWLAGTMDGNAASDTNLTRENMMVKAEVPLNASASIVVNGIVRASTGVNLQAANITVGKDGTTTYNDAELKTGVDFSSIVNVDSLNGAQCADEVLTATKDEKGNVVLTDASGLTGNGAIQITAKADGLNKSAGSIATYLAFDPSTGDGKDLMEYIFGTTPNDTARATVALEAGKIVAAGDVNMTAEATLSQEEKKDSFRSLFANTEAIISLNTNVVAGGDVNMSATADSTFQADQAIGLVDALTMKDTYWGAVVSKISDLIKKGDSSSGNITTADKVKEFFNSVQVGFGYVTSNAKITVAKDVTVTADGSISAAASASADANMSYATGPYAVVKDPSKNNNSGNNSGSGSGSTYEPPFNARMVWEYVDNKSVVDIQGKLTGGDEGSISLSSDATNNSVVKTIINTDQNIHSNYFNLAFNLLTQNNEGKVIVGKNDNSDELVKGGSVAIKANSTYSTDISAIVLQDERAVSSTAFNWLDLDSKAVTDVYADITAKGTLGISANNTAEKLYVTANNAMGKDDMEAKGILRTIGGKIKETSVGNVVTGFVTDIFTKVEGDAKATVQPMNDRGFEMQGKNGGADSNWSKNIALGSAVAVLDADNRADVNIYTTSKLISGCDYTYQDEDTKKDVTVHGLTLNASSIVKDTFIKVRSNLLNLSTENYSASGAAGVILLNNNSNVTLYAGTTTDGNYVSLKTEGTMDVNAYSGYDWDRYNVMKSDVEKEAKATKELLVKYRDLVKNTFNDIKGKIDAVNLNIFDEISFSDLDTPSGASLDDLKKIADDLKKMAEGLKNKINGLKTQLDDVVNTVKSDLDKMKKDIQKNTADLEVQIGRLYTVSERFVDAANYAQIQVSSSISNKDGNPANLSASGSVLVEKMHNSAAVIIGKNAKLEAGKDMNIAAQNKQISVSVDGKFKIIPSFNDVSGSKVGLGGSVSVECNNALATVMVAEGASLNAQGNIEVDGKNTFNNIAVVLGGGKSLTASVTGMVSYMGGNSNALVSIDDEARVIALKKLILDTANTSVFTSVVGDISSSQGGVVGASVGIIDFNTNSLTLISDNDSDKDGSAKDEEEDKIADYGAMLKTALTETVYSAQSGKKADELGGSVEVLSLTMNATTDGVTNNVTVAGMSAGPNGAGNGHGVSNPNVNGGTDTRPKAVIAGAGSVSCNQFEGSTATFIDVGVSLKPTEQDGGVLNLLALDKSFIGGYSGAAAITKGSDSSKFNLTLEGAVAYNDIIKKTRSEIYQAELKGINSLTNSATNTGAQVAAGLALGVEKGDRGPGNFDVAVGASGSLNFVDTAPQAILKNVTVNDNSSNTDINNIAYSKDVQVAGGVTLEFSKADVGIGAAFTLNKIKNDVLALIEGGAYDVKLLNNYANVKLNQVAGAISGGLKLQPTESSWFSANAAVSVNTVNNTVKAYFTDTNTTAEKIDVAARDGKLSSTEEENVYINSLKNQGYDVNGDWAMNLANSTDANLDMDVTENPSQDDEINLPVDVKYTTKKFTADGKDGNTMVGFAAVAPITISAGNIDDSKVKILGSVATNSFTNTFDAKIDNSTINAKSSEQNALSVQSKTNSSLVAVAAGVQIGSDSGVGASGSVVKNSVTDKVTALINNSTLRADNTKIYADDKSQAIGVTGAVGITSPTSGSSLLSAGLTWTQSGLDNITSAKMLGSILDRYNTSGKADLSVQAVNDFSLYSVAAEVGIELKLSSSGSPIVGVRGAYAYNYGVNNTEAAIDKTNEKESKIVNGGNISVSTDDKSKELAVAVAVGFNGGKISGGVHIAKSYIGEENVTTPVTEANNKHQRNKAAINKTTITLAGADSALTVKAVDDSNLTTIAVGGGFSTGGSVATFANLNGSVAKAKNYKDVEAAVNDTAISVAGGLTANKMQVLADNTMKMTTSADGASVGKDNIVGAAAGVATSDSVMTTKATVKDVSTLTASKIGSVEVKAKSFNQLTNVGVALCGELSTGIMGTNFGIDALANVACNDLKNDTIALVDDFDVDADSVKVEAKSEEKITNVVGAANIELAFGGGNSIGIGLGAAVAVNNIHGDTIAEVKSSNLNVKDNFTVLADALHRNKNVVFSGGLPVQQGVFSVDAVGNAVVSDNEISGNTKALVTNSKVNEGVTDSNAVVDVKAKDNIVLDSTTADAQVALSITFTAGVNISVLLGAGVLCEDLSRNTEAQVLGTDGNHSVINAKTFNVNAISEEDVDVANACVGASLAVDPAALIALAAGNISPQGALAVSVASTHVDNKGITLANVNYVDSVNQGMLVNAEHKEDVYGLGVAASAGLSIFAAGVGVDVYKTTNDVKTFSLLQNSVITHNNGTLSDDKITATNDLILKNKEIAVDLALVLGIEAGVAIWSNDFKSVAQAKVIDTSIGTADERASNVDVLANTKVDEKFNSVEVGFGALAVGVNKVRNTINTNTNADITATAAGTNNVYADYITINANEDRKVTDNILEVTLGVLSVAVSDIVTNIGFEGNGTYTIKYSDKVTEETIDAVDESLAETKSITVYDTDLTDAKTKDTNNKTALNTQFTDKLNTLNGNIDSIGSTDPVSYTGNVFNIGGLTQTTAPTTVTAGVHSGAKNMTLDAAKGMNITTDVVNNIKSTSKSYPMPIGVYVDVIKNFVNLHQNNTVDITSATLKAGGTLKAGNTVSGSVNTYSEDAKFANVLAVTVVESASKRDGTTELKVTNSKLLCDDGNGFITLKNLDTTKLNADVHSGGSGIISGGYLEAETKDSSRMKMSITGTDVGGTVIFGKNITVENVLAPQLDSTIVYGGFDPVNGQGTLATAWLGNDDADSTDKTNDLSISNADIFGDKVDILNGLSDNDGNKAKLTAYEKVKSVGILEISVNKGRTTSITNVNTNITNIRSNAALANTLRTSAGLAQSFGVGDWRITSYDSVGIANTMENAEVGLGVCTGTNYTRNVVNNKNIFTLGTASGTTLEVKNLKILTESAENATVTVEANDGGILEISPVAAGVKNEITYTTSLTIGGKYAVLGNADIQSKHKSDLTLKADGHCGSVVGGSGIMVKSNATLNNALNVTNAEITTLGTLTLESLAQVDVNKNYNTDGDKPDDFMLYASNKGGLANGVGSKLNNTVTIHNSTNVTGSKLHSFGNMLVKSHGEHHIFATQSGVSSGIAVGATESRVHNTVDEDNKVVISGNTELYTLDKNAELFVVATDKTSASAKGFSERTFSVAAGAASYVYDTVTRDNIITINYGGKLRSFKNVNLFANLDEKNVLGQMLIQESSRTFTSGAIVVPFSKIESNLTQNSQVDVKSGASVESIGDVNIYADAGLETIDRKLGSYCWYKNNLSEEFMSTSKGNLANGQIVRDNWVKADGTITAGILSNLKITIGGTGNPVIVVPDDVTQTQFNLNPQGYTVYTPDEYASFIAITSDLSAEDLKALTGLSPEALQPTLITIGDTSDPVLQNIQKLLGEYAADGTDTTTYKALKAAEQLRIQEMSRGSGTTDTGSHKLSENMCVTIPNIVAGGGNVNIETDKLEGAGTITAKGMQNVEIINNSSMTLKINDITITNPGGQVNYNGTTLPQTGYIGIVKGINYKNAVIEGNVTFTVNSSATSDVPTISIEGKWTGAGVNFTPATRKLQNYKFDDNGNIVLDADGNPVVVYMKRNAYGEYVVCSESEADVEIIEEGTAYFPADIYLLGAVENLAGKVVVHSKANDIVVTSAKGSGIRGSTISITAEQGSFTQLSPESTVNIGGSPEIAYQDLYRQTVEYDKQKYDQSMKDPTKGFIVTTWEDAFNRGLMPGDLSYWFYTLSSDEKAHLNKGEIKVNGVYKKLTVGGSSGVDINPEVSNHVYYNCRPLWEYMSKLVQDVYSLGVFDYKYLNIYHNNGGKFIWEGNITKGASESFAMRTVTRNDGDMAKGAPGTIEGGNIFILGSDININGIVQSGYGKYQLALTEADEARIQEIKATHTANNQGATGNLTDAEVLNNSQYCIREGGAVWDSATNSYRYEMAAYYNPDDDTVVTPSVNSQGGQINLIGRIVSTGDGSIKCLDGVSTINVENTFDHNLAINDLVVNDIQGKVTIVDTGLERSVEITRDGVTPIKYDGNMSASGHITGGNGHYTYQPKQNLSYEWLSGEAEQTIKTYETTKRATWWGWSDYKEYGSEVFKSEDPDTKFIGQSPLELRTRTEGSFIVEEDNFQNQFLMITHTYNGHANGAKTLQGSPTAYTTGFYGCHKWLKFTWTEKNGYSFTNQARMRADMPFTIDFIGVKPEDGYVNISNIGNAGQDKTVKLYGNIGNTKLYEIKDPANGTTITGRVEKGSVNIKSNGSIDYIGGNIYAKDVDLSAKGNINNVQIKAGDIVNLDAWSTLADGKVNVSVSKNGVANGAVQVGAFGGADNKNASVALASLTSQGDILRANTAKYNNGIAIVQGDRIDLISTEGQIGAADNFLFVNGGQIADTSNSMSASVNAEAKNNIYLHQTQGNLRVGRIIVNDLDTDGNGHGNLYIEVPEGSIQDAQTVVVDSEEGTKKDLLDEWASLGLIDDGSEVAKKQIAMKNEMLQAERKALIRERDNVRKQEVIAELQERAEIHGVKEQEHDQQVAVYQAIINDTSRSDEDRNTATNSLNAINTSWNTYLTAYNDKISELEELRDSEALNVTEERKEEINNLLATMPETYQVWNGEQMLYAMQSRIINPSPGAEPSRKDPNLYAQNINLKVRDNVGILNANEKVISTVDLYKKDGSGKFIHIDDIRAISWADPGTAIYKSDAQTITLKEQIVIGLQEHSGVSNPGKLTVTGYAMNDNYLTGDVNLETRRFQDLAKSNTLELTVDAVKANGDVRITGLKNILSSAETNKAAIITKGNLFLNVGDSEDPDCFSIGASDKFFAVKAAGNTQLLATGDIYLQSIGNLNVLDIVAGRKDYADIGGKINISTLQLDGNTDTGNIYGVYVPTQDVQGNIRSDNSKSITLNAAGSIGSWTDSKKTIRFKNVAVDAGVDAILSLTAGKEIVVEGVSTAAPLAEKLDGKYQVPAQGKLVIAELDSTTAKKARITVNGAVELDDTVDFGRNNGSELDIYSAGKLKVTGSVTADTLVLSGAAGVQLTGTAIGTNVTLQAGVKPELTANVLSVAITDNADVTTSDLAATPAYVGGIQAVNLAVKANRDIDLGGTDKIKVDNADFDTTRNVKFNNYSVSGFVDGNTKSSVKVYNSADTVDESCVNGGVDITFGDGNANFVAAPQILVTKGIDAVGKIKILSSGGLGNAENADIYSEKNNIIVRAEKDLINNGRIFVENKENTDGIYGYVATGSNFVNNNIIGGDAACIILGAQGSLTNKGDVYSNQQSVCLMALEEIINKGNAAQLIQEYENNLSDFYTDDNYQFISAGKNVALCAGEGLKNEAVIAGGLTYAGHRTATGGNVFMDDFENFTGNIGTELQTAMDAAFAETDYTESGGEFKSKGDIHNLGLVVAYKGETAGSGLVHFDSSSGKTENEGAIYSVDGEVFMDSTEDLINHRDIFVINTDTTDAVSCNVTLQATGNIYNTGDITVRGKGAVLIDADAMDQASMTAHGKTIEGLVSDGESALNSYKKISTINLTDDAGNPAGTLTYLGIYNTGNIFTNEGDVTFKSFAGSIYNTDELADVTSSAALTKSNGNILMEAPRGSVENTKALYATKNIEITSKSHIYNLPALNENAPTEYAGQSIMRGLTSENGDIKLTSNAGAIVNDGIIETKNGDIFLTANGCVEYKRLKDEDGNGRINFDDLKYEVTDADSKTYEELATEYFATDKGKIKAGIYNHTDSDYIANGGNIVITSVYTIDASGSFTALKKDAYGTEHTGKGNITVTANGDSSGQNGDIYHYAHTNTQVKEGSGVFISETYGPGEDAYEMVRADGAIKYSAKNKAYLITDMIAEDSVKLTFDEGTTISKEIICLNGDVTIQTKGQSSDGNLLVNAKITSGGAVNLISAGNLTFGGDAGTNNARIEAKDDITLTAERDIKVIDATNLATEEGGLELTSNKGGIDVKGDITAKDFVRLYTKGDNEETRAGDYTERFDEGAYTAPSNISAGAISGIKVADDITTNGDLDIATYGDDVSVQNLTADKMAAVGTSGGKINIAGTIKGNDVALYSEKETADINFGKIEVTEKLILAGNEFNLDMSNIQTDSDLFDLYVYGAIGADGTVNPTGSIKIDYRNIPGGEKKDVRIRQMNAVNAEIHTAGALTIDNLSVANRAEIDVMGTKTDVFGTMQAADADAQFIYYDPGKGATALDLSHVYFGYDLASKQAHVEALSRDPSIFEKPAYNPDACPVCAEEANASLTAGGGSGTVPGTIIGGTGNKGHKFEQSSSGTQRFAGVLLMNNFGYKSYAQRFSAEDLMTHLEDIKAVGQFDNYFNIGMDFFDRFNIIDIPDVAVNSITLNNTFRDSGIIVVRDDKKEDEYDF